MKTQTEENTGGSQTGRGAVLTRYWSRCVYARWVKVGRRPWCKEWGFGRWTSEEPSLQRNCHPTWLHAPCFLFYLPMKICPAVKTNHSCRLSLSTSFPLVNASATLLISSGYAHLTCRRWPGPKSVRFSFTVQSTNVLIYLSIYIHSCQQHLPPDNSIPASQFQLLLLLPSSVEGNLLTKNKKTNQAGICKRLFYVRRQHAKRLEGAERCLIHVMSCR